MMGERPRCFGACELVRCETFAKVVSVVDIGFWTCMHCTCNDATRLRTCRHIGSPVIKAQEILPRAHAIPSKSLKEWKHQQFDDHYK